MSTIERPAREASASAVNIRPMVAADLGRVIAIENASYTMPWSDETFRTLILRGDAEAIVADDAGEVVGYAVFWWVVDQAELGNVAVDGAHRRRGIGELLVPTTIERARGRCMRELFLEVRPSNPVAQRLYERLGFVHVGRRRNYYVRPTEDALVMRRGLEDR